MRNSDSFKIQGFGGKKNLGGAIEVGGAKNAALPLLAASVLCDGTVEFVNVPRLSDIEDMRSLLSHIGVQSSHEENACTISVSEIINYEVEPEIACRMRASIVLSGPLLARLGKVIFPHPGGCVIGARPIDLFLSGFEKMGAKVEDTGMSYEITAQDGKLKGANIIFKIQSHVATEALMMAAALAEGTTTLINAACEPEIVDVANFLNSCGARIEGAGTHTITIYGNGGKPLSQTQPHSVIPDRIEAGSYLILGALCAHDLQINNCEPEHLLVVTDVLQEVGYKIDIEGNSIILKDNKEDNSHNKGVSVRTHEYPGFVTDLQSPYGVLLTQVQGESTIFETIFEGRLGYTEGLVSMGADISVLDPHRAVFKGPTPLKGGKLSCLDIRAGMAYIIAALVAGGESTLSNIVYVDRGYERIEEKLTKLGANISRM